MYYQHTVRVAQLILGFGLLCSRQENEHLEDLASACGGEERILNAVCRIVTGTERGQ